MSLTTTNPRVACGDIPVEELAELAAREGKRPKEIYGAHKWFARRAGSAFRALLIASEASTEDDFWDAFENGSLEGVRVLDPFVGGGTSVVEASILGADATGIDVDPVACAITSFETRAGEVEDIGQALSRARARVWPRLKEFYLHSHGGEERTILHTFWVQVVICSGCSREIEAHPSHRLAWNSDHHRQWAFCSACHRPQELHDSRRHLRCPCGEVSAIDAGHVERGLLTCPDCHTSERLIDVSERVPGPPRFVPFAHEILPAGHNGVGRALIAEREFVAADPELPVGVDEALAAAGAPRLDDRIPIEGRSDDRLVRYGYRRYSQLFNPRQRLHLRLLSQAIAKEKDEVREALAIAFSDHLATNCMLTCYAGGWRRLVPLFTIKAFRHIPRPVEINPWADGAGRGSYPNAVRQVARSTDAARELRPANGPGRVSVIHDSATELRGVEDESIDLVLTDPPYFDNVDYSELADFYRPWLAKLKVTSGERELISASLAARGRGEENAAIFASSLGLAFAQVERVLRRGGRLVFTFRHSSVRGWQALEAGLAAAPGLVCETVFPLLAEAPNSLHTHPQSAVWDAVLVFRRDEPGAAGKLEDAIAHASHWRERLDQAELTVPFRDADAENFAQACRLAATRGARL